MVVVGNKLDRAEGHRQLKQEVGEGNFALFPPLSLLFHLLLFSSLEYARQVGASFAEVSAKTKEGIDEVFVEIAEKLLRNRNSVYVFLPSI